MSVEYQCVIHYEDDRVIYTFKTMAEAVTAMQTASLTVTKKPVFAEVLKITTERIAFQTRRTL